MSEICDAIIRAYQDELMTYPTSPEDWLEVESVFRRRWNIPHALVALDGKHIPIRCPRWVDSLYNNYKGASLYSTPGPGGWMLQIPQGGRGGSAQILRHKTEDGSISFPESESLVADEPKVNFFILGTILSPSNSG